jgi:hypothetical protein
MQVVPRFAHGVNHYDTGFHYSTINQATQTQALLGQPSITTT